jgi:hypothetical protein
MLNAWGKHRFFLAQYFNVVEACDQRQQIIVIFNAQYIQLNIAQAPDFMQESLYLKWLTQPLTA